MATMNLQACLYSVFSVGQEHKGYTMNLTGKCLIARPTLTDSFFKHSVVFVYEHSTRGVMGIVLNKRTTANTKMLMENKGFDSSVPSEPLYAGGPVNERAVVMLHSADWGSGNTMNVNKRFSVTSDDIMLFKYSQGDTPRYYRFFTGSSVWHTAQIKQEMARNNWLTSDLNLDTIFDTDSRELWDIAVEQAATETMDKFI